MATEHVLVFFSSPNGIDQWSPVERENLPQWLCDPEIWDQMLQGQQVVNTEDPAPLYYKILQPLRPRQVHEHAPGDKIGRIILPN